MSEPEPSAALRASEVPSAETMTDGPQQALPGKGNTETPVPPVTTIVPPQRGIPPRSQRLAMVAVDQLLLKTQKQSMRKRFYIWQHAALSQQAANLIERGDWQQQVGGDGGGLFKVVDTISCAPESTANLEEYLATRTNALCDSLSSSLRRLVATSLRSDSGKTLWPSHLDPLPPYRPANDRSTAAYLEGVRAIVESLLAFEAETQVLIGKVQFMEHDAARLNTAVKQLEDETVQLKKQSTAAAETSEELRNAQHENAQLKERLHASCEELNRVTADLAVVQKELVNERKGIPTDLEKVLDRKNARLVAVEQELAKLRLRARTAAKSEEQLQLRIKELESDVSLLEQSRMLSIKRGTRSLSGDRPLLTDRASPMMTRRSESEQRIVIPPLPISSLPSQTQQQQQHGATYTALPSEPRSITLTDSDAEFAPEETPSRRYVVDDGEGPNLASSPSARLRNSQEEKEYRDLVLRNRLMEEELLAREPPVVPCPHCHTPLTLFQNAASNSARGSAKYAFCFSCRRSFSESDVHAMKSPLQIRRK